MLYSSLDKTVKLQATFAFRFMCKHITVKLCYISQGMGVRKVSNSKSDLQNCSRSLTLVPLDRPNTVFS